MEFLRASDFRSERSWGSRLLLDLGDHAARLHWTRSPYRWHVNRGRELFVVLAGEVVMHVEHSNGEVSERLMRSGDIYLFEQDERHRAEPRGEARILVVEACDTD